MNVVRNQEADPSARLNDYLTAFASRDATAATNCFAPSAVVELPMVKPNRLMGLKEIAAAHALAFGSLSNVTLETREILSTEGSAMAAGQMTVVCRGKKEIHSFAIASESSSNGLSRASWYFDSRRHRLWSDKTVL